MSVSEPGGDLREALETIWTDWLDNDPERLMSFNDFLAPEIESTLRVTFRFIIRKHLRNDPLATEERVEELIEEWVRQFSKVMRDKRPKWRDWAP